MKEEQLSTIDSALVDIIQRGHTNDELERINQDLKAVRKMLLIFSSSVVLWAASITAIIHMLR